MSRDTKDKADRKELKKRCEQLQVEREEMWERLGMNWRESSCLPKPIEMVACAFLSRLIK
jgi:hypothetical protein